VHHLISPVLFVFFFFLDRETPNRWIGRRGLIPQPSCFLDFTPLDIFFCGLVKDIVMKMSDNPASILIGHLRNTF
jgi:hypothetical protein